MSKFDSAVNFTYNVIVSPFKLGFWAWKKVRSNKDAVVRNDSCPCFKEIPVVADTSKIDAAWPPAPHPVEALSVHDLFAANGNLIRELCYASKLSEEEIERFLLPVISNLAMIVHLVPASEYDHHQGYGGLFTHSLEVAYYAANEAKNTIFDRSAPPKVIHLTTRRWILTAILAALCHDIGKVFTDVTITASDGRHWPATQPILTWLRRNKIESYYISFRPGRKHNAHKIASHMKSTMLIPSLTLEFLSIGGYGEVMEDEFSRALLHGKEGGLIGRILDNADGSSRYRDQIRQRQIRPEFKNVSHPQADQLLRAIRILIQHAIWTTNADVKSRVFNTKQGCFIAWSEEIAGEARNQASSMGYVSLPSDFMKLASVLVDANVAVRNSDEISNTQNIFWRVTPIVLGTTQVNCIKLSDPNFIFDAVPPARIEAIVEGQAVDEETRNAWITQWKFMPVQRISRNEEVEMGYTEDFIESLAKDAEEHLREAEELERSIKDYNDVSTGDDWVPQAPMTEHPTTEENPASISEADIQSVTPQNDQNDLKSSDDDFASAMADFDDDDDVVDDEIHDSPVQQPQNLPDEERNEHTPITPAESAPVSKSEEQRPLVGLRRQKQAATLKPSNDQADESPSLKQSHDKASTEINLSIVMADVDDFDNAENDDFAESGQKGGALKASVSTQATNEDSLRASQKQSGSENESAEFNMSALLGDEDDDVEVISNGTTRPSQPHQRRSSSDSNRDTQSEGVSSASKLEAQDEMSEETVPANDDFEKSQAAVEPIESIGSIDWGTYADLDGNAPFDDDMPEVNTGEQAHLPTGNQRSPVQLNGEDQAHESAVQTVQTEQGDTPEMVPVPVVFFNQPIDHEGRPVVHPTAKSVTGSRKPSPGHFKDKETAAPEMLDEDKEGMDAEDKRKHNRGRPPMRSEADRQYEEAEHLVKDMTTQMEHGMGLFIEETLTLDYASGLLGTSSKAFEQAVRDLGIDEFLVEMILEKQSISDIRPRIEWNRKDGKILFVR